MGYELTGCGLQVIGYRLRVAGYRLQVASCKLQVAGLSVWLRNTNFQEIMKNYKDLEIYQPAYKLTIEVHNITMKLPKYEMYEQGSQIKEVIKKH